MKLSLRFPDDDDDGPTVKLKLKLPLLFPGQPHPRPAGTLSATASSSTATFSLSTHFPSFPSLSISYASPTPTSTSTSPHRLSSSSVSLSLKSGVGLFGSPKGSPLVFSARFSLLGSGVNFSPVFYLRVKPDIGHFSFRRSTSSKPGLGADFRKEAGQSFLGSGSAPRNDKAAFVAKEGSFSDILRKSTPDEAEYPSPRLIKKRFEEKEGFWTPKASDGNESRVAAGHSAWDEVKLEPCLGNPDDGVLTESTGATRKGRSFSGFTVRARTVLPVTRQVAVNVQWGVNLPNEVSRGMPYLSVSKLEIERIEDKNSGVIADSDGGSGNCFGDAEMLKGTWSLLRRDVESIRKENGEMKKCLEEIGLGAGKWSKIGVMSGTEKKDLKSAGEKTVDFEKWRGRKNAREENRGKENQISSPVDLESRLRNAIMSASSS